MWTRNTKNLVPGYYWYRYKYSDWKSREDIYETFVIQVTNDKTGDYPETMQMGDDCCGPSLFPQDMEKMNAWIWNQPIKEPKFSKELIDIP